VGTVCNPSINNHSRVNQANRHKKTTSEGAGGILKGKKYLMNGSNHNHSNKSIYSNPF
jgi:hypothetical protein